MKKFLKSIIRVIAFFFPKPINIWLHRLAGGSIGKHVSIPPGVLLLVENLEIQDEAVIKFGTMMRVRTFKLGRKSSIGYFTLVNGADDFIVKSACVIGAKSIINCDRSVTFEYYSGNGPGCYIYTHGSFLPVTEGYRSTFGPIRIEEKVWIQMNCNIGPGVSIGKGSVIMPGTVLLESVEANKMVVGDPAKLMKVPILKQPMKNEKYKDFARKILTEYRIWSNNYNKTDWKIEDDVLFFNENRNASSLSVDGESDIVILTEPGKIRNGMYFNLCDLTTDSTRDTLKMKLEDFLRLHYGLIFLDPSKLAE